MADRDDDEPRLPPGAQEPDNTPLHPDQRKVDELREALERNRRQQQEFEQRSNDAAPDDPRRVPFEPLGAEQEERMLNPYLAELADRYPDRGDEQSPAQRSVPEDTVIAFPSQDQERSGTSQVDAETIELPSPANQNLHVPSIDIQFQDAAELITRDTYPDPHGENPYEQHIEHDPVAAGPDAAAVRSSQQVSDREIAEQIATQEAAIEHYRSVSSYEAYHALREYTDARQERDQRQSERELTQEQTEARTERRNNSPEKDRSEDDDGDRSR